MPAANRPRRRYRADKTARDRQTKCELTGSKEQEGLAATPAPVPGHPEDGLTPALTTRRDGADDRARGAVGTKHGRCARPRRATRPPHPDAGKPNIGPPRGERQSRYAQMAGPPAWRTDNRPAPLARAPRLPRRRFSLCAATECVSTRSPNGQHPRRGRLDPQRAYTPWRRSGTQEAPPRQRRHTPRSGGPTERPGGGGGGEAQLRKGAARAPPTRLCGHNAHEGLALGHPGGGHNASSTPGGLGPAWGGVALARTTRLARRRQHPWESQRACEPLPPRTLDLALVAPHARVRYHVRVFAH